MVKNRFLSKGVRWGLVTATSSKGVRINKIMHVNYLVYCKAKSKCLMKGAWHTWSLIFEKEPRTHNEEKIVTSISVLGKLEIHTKKNKTGPLSYTSCKN